MATRAGLDDRDVERILEDLGGLGEVGLPELLSLEPDYSGLEVLRYFVHSLGESLLRSGEAGRVVLDEALRDLSSMSEAMMMAVEWYSSMQS